MNKIDETISTYLVDRNDFSHETMESASLAFLDAYGCILDAAADQNALKHALPFGLSSSISEHPFRVIRNLNSELEIARYLGTLVRWHDYNDTFLAKEWAHPSDNIGGIIASNMRYLDSPELKDIFIGIIKTYEIQGNLALGTSLNEKGYDHVFYVKLATAAYSSSLMNNSSKTTISRTINNVLSDGLNLRAYRHEPNIGRRKSWAAGDATSRGLWLAQVSSYNDSNYSSVQTDEVWGFEKVFLDGESIVLGKDLDDWVVRNILYKVAYPAEFHGQSAVEAAISLHPIFTDRFDDIKSIIIETHEPALRIISKSGPLDNPSARDHSLEYMTSVALLDGELTTSSYQDSYEKIHEVESLRKRFKTIENKQYTKDYYDIEKRYIPNKVYFEYKDGTHSEKKEILYPIGHPARRDEAIPLLKDKFVRNCERYHSEVFASNLWDETLYGSLTSQSLFDFLENVSSHE